MSLQPGLGWCSRKPGPARPVQTAPRRPELLVVGQTCRSARRRLKRLSARQSPEQPSPLRAEMGLPRARNGSRKLIYHSRKTNRLLACAASRDGLLFCSSTGIPIDGLNSGKPLERSDRAVGNCPEGLARTMGNHRERQDRKWQTITAHGPG